MQTTPELDALLDELMERSAIVDELDGPQVEAWASSLFPLFDEDLTASVFLQHCAEQHTTVASLLCEALAVLATGEFQREAAECAERLASVRPPAADQIGESVATNAWMVTAPFGSSVVIGFENPRQSDGASATDAGHSVLVELNVDGHVEDLQLAGPPADLVDEAVDVGDRVRAEPVTVDTAADAIIAAWPHSPIDPAQSGPGLSVNETFVRARLRTLTGIDLPKIEIVGKVIDTRRGLDETDYREANAAARSTLRAALGPVEMPAELLDEHRSWMGVIRGDGGELSARERDGLLWLEWADWLGAGIGLVRSGEGTPISGAVLVDMVNRCPEVSSSIEKGDRDYAEWAFEVALDLLTDAALVSDGTLSSEGLGSLHVAMAASWADAPIH